MMAVATSVMILSIVSGCEQGNHDPERYVLTGSDKNLFFHRQIATDPGKVNEIAGAVRSFARKHGMDFLMAKDSLPQGDFNISANGPSLNIKAIYNAAIGDAGVQIFAIVPKAPTARDKALVTEFVAKLESIEAKQDKGTAP